MLEDPTYLAYLGETEKQEEVAEGLVHNAIDTLSKALHHTRQENTLRTIFIIQDFWREGIQSLRVKLNHLGADDGDIHCAGIDCRNRRFSWRKVCLNFNVNYAILIIAVYRILINMRIDRS